MEGTGVYWLAPYEALEQAGIEPALLHAQHVKQIKGRKTDKNDSIWLARLCQFGLATPSYVPPRRFRQLRQLCRYRCKLVSEGGRAQPPAQDPRPRRPATGGRAERHARDERQTHPRRAGRRAAARAHPGRAERARAGQAGTGGAHAGGRARPALAVEAARPAGGHRRAPPAHRRTRRPRAGRPQRLPAPSAVAGNRARHLADQRAILVELGPDLQAFPDPRHLGAWAGVCPGNHESAGKRRFRRARKGNPTLRATLAECAQGAVRTKGTTFHGFHRTLATRSGYKRAILATAYKMLRGIYAMLCQDRPYRDPGIDYEQLVVRRNASRWLRKLKKYGFLEEEQQRA